MIEIYDRKGFDRIASIESDTLVGSDLNGRDLTNGNFVQMDLANANLSGCNLTDTDFRLCNLQDVDLSNANLNGADFSGANLCGANFENAKFENTILTGATISLASLPYLSDIKDINIEEIEFA